MASLLDIVDQVTVQAKQKGALESIQTTASIVAEQGIPFIVRWVDSLEKKEKSDQSKQQQKVKPKDFNPFLPYDKDLYVDDLTESHVCLLNKFNVVDRHVLIVTKAFESQEELISVADFYAALQCLGEMDGLVFFNGGKNAGASQPHKHLQMVPLPSFADSDNPFERFLAQQGLSTSPSLVPALKFPLVAAQVECETFSMAEAKRLYDIYLSALKKLQLFESATAPARGDYNCLFTRRHLWLVPRSSSAFAGIGVNSLGFAGTILLKRQEQIEQLKEVGIVNLLTNVCE